jgi:transcriptional regulator with XRE-family HTH domain
MSDSHPVDVHVGKRLKNLRLMRKMTQGDVAKKLTISFQQVQKYELGRNRISASKLYEIAAILDVQISYFFEGLDETGGGGPVLDPEIAKLAGQLAQLPTGAVKNSITGLITAVTSERAA